jgi:hypothetical protein
VKPPDVVVKHSRYWRSPHFTFEYAYYFEIEANAALQKQLLEENKLRRVGGKELEDVHSHATAVKRPAWFIPRDIENYDVWVYPPGVGVGQHFAVFIDKNSGALFITDVLL